MGDEEDPGCAQDDFFTTYYRSYQPYKPNNFAKIADKKPQRDEMVMTGHFTNNLQVDGRIMKSKVWPESTFGIEELTSFIERLRKCKKLIYDMFFRKPDIRMDIIEQHLRELEKTVYQVSYSPNEYVTVSEKRRIANSPYSANMKYYETTYRTYYNRIQELERFKEYMIGKIPKQDRESVKKELRKIYITGRSTYYETICLPAIVVNKSKNTLESPIDIHSWRRV